MKKAKIVELYLAQLQKVQGRCINRSVKNERQINKKDKTITQIVPAILRVKFL
jgi:hypothetical protein